MKPLRSWVGEARKVPGSWLCRPRLLQLPWPCVGAFHVTWLQGFGEHQLLESALCARPGGRRGG